MSTQTVAPTLNCFQCLKRCIIYLDVNPHKIIFYPSNSYDVSNVIIITWSNNKVEDYTTHNFLEFHQDADNSRIIKRRWSVLGIIHTLLGVDIFWKANI